MQLATIRVNDTEILSLSCTRIDAPNGLALVELVAASVKRGARCVVLDFAPTTTVDFAGARAVRVASELVGDGGRLSLAGLNGRARALLRSLRVSEHVQLIEWWTDAIDPIEHDAMAA
jgi:hypothetical protein